MNSNYVNEIKSCSIRILLHFCDYQLPQRDLLLLNSDHLALCEYQWCQRDVVLLYSDPLALLWLPITSARFSVAQFGSCCISVITNYVSEIKCYSIRILLHFCDCLVPLRDSVLLNSDPLARLWLPITSARFSVAQLGSSCTSVITSYVSANWCCSIRILLQFSDYQLLQRDLVLLNSDTIALLWLTIASTRFSVAQFGSTCTSVITNYASEI